VEPGEDGIHRAQPIVPTARATVRPRGGRAPGRAPSC